jgi:hypothetical protein
MSAVLPDSPAARRLADRLDTVRRRRFVGRVAELALFDAALQAAEPFFAVLHLYGPGGVGKTTLLQELGRVAQAAGRRVIYLDSRDIDPSPSGFLIALSMALGIPPSAATPALLAAYPDLVLLIDTYEALAALDGWLRGVLLPNLAGRGLAVIAGREMPAAIWRTDLAWGALTRVVALRNLAPEDARAYLAAAGVPPPAHAAALAFTHGHPLALSLVADLAAQSETTLDLDAAAPDLLRILLDHFVQSVPSPRHRLGLEACAHVRMTTESMLADMLGDAGGEVFGWLRGLCFVQQGPFGLFPHDLARDVLDGDLRWRDPIGYAELHRRVRASIVRQFQATTGLVQQQMFLNILYLHRLNPLIRPYYDWSVVQPAYTEPAQPADHAAIVALIRQHEGEQTAAIARFWLERQPAAFSVVRTGPQDLIGLLCILKLETPTADELAADPALDAAWRTIQSAPPQPGELWLLHRFWLDAASGHVPGTVYNQVAVMSSRAWLTLPNLSWSVIIASELALWEPALHYVRQRHAPETDFALDGRTYGGFVHDWRVEPWGPWMDAMAERELETQATPDNLPLPQTEPPRCARRCATIHGRTRWRAIPSCTAVCSKPTAAWPRSSVCCAPPSPRSTRTRATPSSTAPSGIPIWSRRSRRSASPNCWTSPSAPIVTT